MTDRGVSVTISYVLSLAIATLLITGLLYAAGDVIGDRRESVTRAELRVVGEQISSDLMTADRLAQTGADTVVVEAAGPNMIAGRQYTVAVNATSQEVVLETTSPDVTVRVPFRNTTSVADSRAPGGDVQIVLSGGELEVQSP